MAIDKAVDSAALDSALTDIANAIRTKTGGTDPLTLEQMPGEIANIEAGGDPREVYQGTRPAEWLRLPDYDKVADRTMYCLVALFPSGTNKVSFGFRCYGNCTMTAGKVVNGEFVAFENDTPVIVAGTGYTGDCTITRIFDYADYNDIMRDGTKQIVVKIETTDIWNRLWSNTSAGQYYINNGVLDIIVRRDDVGKDKNITQSFIQTGNLQGCRYYYNFGNDIPPALVRAQYVKTQSGICSPTTRLYLAELRKFVGTVKLKDYWETFRQCSRLEELICDISEAASWENPFFAVAPCYCLRKLLFVGSENLTSFPGDINLTSTSLDVDAVLAFFNTLPDISTSDTRTITLKNTPAASEGIPDDTLAVATNKGWTVVTA